MKETDDLKLALAVSWAIRATGKMSHAGFDACMENVKKFVPVEIWDKYYMGMANLYAHEGIFDFIEETANSLPENIQIMIGGDMPSIERLKEALRIVKAVQKNM